MIIFSKNVWLLILCLAGLAEFAVVFEIREATLDGAEFWRSILALKYWSDHLQSHVGAGFWVRPIWGQEGLVFGLLLPTIEFISAYYFYITLNDDD